MMLQCNIESTCGCHFILFSSLKNLTFLKGVHFIFFIFTILAPSFTSPSIHPVPITMKHILEQIQLAETSPCTLSKSSHLEGDSHTLVSFRISQNEDRAFEAPHTSCGHVGAIHWGHRIRATGKLVFYFVR